MTNINTCSICEAQVGLLWSAWLPRFFNFIFFTTFTLKRSVVHSAEMQEFPLLLSDNSLIWCRDFLGISYAYRETLLCCTMVLVVVLAVLVLAWSVISIAASFSCSLFYRYLPCGVWTTNDQGSSALDFIMPWLHLPALVACTPIGWVGSSLSFSLAAS